MHPFHLLLSVFSLIALVTFAYLMRYERANFIIKGKGNSWLRVRISSVPIAFVVFALVIIPTGSISGMEGLVVFYVLMFSVIPIIWFAGHWLIGKSANPPLSFAESATIAGSPLVFLLVTAYVAHVLQTPAWLFLKALGF
jgi:hypothetical protein